VLGVHSFGPLPPCHSMVICSVLIGEGIRLATKTLRFWASYSYTSVPTAAEFTAT